MSDKKTEQPSERDMALHTTLSAAYQRPDWLLQLFVNLANNSGVNASVTLVVGGALITGELISGRDYLTELGKQIGAGINEERGADIFGPLRDTYYKRQDADESEETDDRGPAYVHLRKVQIFVGDKVVPTKLSTELLWRGRLAAVDGFILGEARPG